ncbi:hypothetical protein BO86DRAFT_317517 [Aspergillus japonicus CBS 114.51]|uniref:Glucosamine 6-phosphate N-acetyltransferase n=1 Tax=Aspergillus japonicus CBS 114.51 TaxID=1448312 RepID=A0A8T8WWY7_ASPJA|nr:hypothetical protein BO86DRAFT_317517 [Aspergillus japonicus CBS 114.51]RAH79809.1 hypothetical protein BO86DRAFT_317517 [Aspergillus japonicus CBS 114.51]
MTFTTHLLAPPSPASNPTTPPKFTLPTPTTPNPPTNPPLLTDALTIRQTVFIDEQHCSAEEEIDADDGRSWHWVVYHSPDAPRTPVATIRLVPPPNVHSHHPNHSPNPNGAESGAEQAAEQDQEQEPYIKLTRVAVLREYRGYGLGRAVVETALAWAREHAREIDEAAVAFAFATASAEKDGGEVVARPVWNGLVLVHAQTQVEKMYERCGFVTDEGMGRWDENEIEHLGMWRRLVLE